MPRKGKNPTIKELRRQLAAQEGKLTKILSRRALLLAKLQAIDGEIAALGGEIPAAKRGKPRKAAGKATKPKGTRRRASGKPLADYIVKVLTGAEAGLRVKDIAPAVIKGGYKTKSKGFYGLVAAAVRDDSRFKRLRRGVYALA